MGKPLLWCLFRVSLLLLISAGSQAPQADGDWTRVLTGGKTTCALGTPYSFFHREGTDPNLLLLYFQGGGACWHWVSCNGLFDPSVEEDELSGFAGIFDRNHPENPFADFGAVFVPYCTGDVHIGDASRRYGDAKAHPIQHRGYRNVAAVLDWVEARNLRPETVVVAGTSAGAYGALFYTPEIARIFPSARVVMIGDSGVPLLSDNSQALQSWGGTETLPRIWRNPWTPETEKTPLLEAYRQTSASHSRISLAQITSDRDRIQSGFYLVSGSPEWRPATYRLLERARAENPSLRSFIVAGWDHGLLHTDAFYSYEADGLSLKDWVSGLILGKKTRNVRCGECTPPEDGQPSQR